MKTAGLLVCASLGGLLVACDGGASKPAGPATYTLSARADRVDPPGGVKVAIAWPAGWKQEEVTPMGPRVRPAGADGVLEAASVLLRACPEPAAAATIDAATCTDQLVARLYGDDVTQEAAGNDRVWIEGTINKLSVGRLLVYHAPTRSIVDCGGMLLPERARMLGEVRAICASLSIL